MERVNKKRVLFLCTGNSCRSQMAEGLVNHFWADDWEAFSAGTKPSGYVHPMAVRVMAELGIDISGQQSKSTDEFKELDLDDVITVCDHAARNCPAWLGQGRVRHLPFPDPAAADGEEQERLAVFRSVRDGLYERIGGLLSTPQESDTVEVHFDAKRNL